MSFATFWIEDTFTSIASLPGFTAGPALDWDELAEINRLSHAEVMERRMNGHRPYVARMYGQPVGYGWLATSKVSIGELDINVELPVLATSLIRLIFKFYAGFSIRESSFYSQRGSSERFFGKHTDHK